MFIKMYHLRAWEEGTISSESWLCEPFIAAPATVAAVAIAPQIFTQTPLGQGGASPSHCGEPGCPPREVTAFQQTTLQFIYKGLPHAWESIIEQLSFLCRLNPLATNSKNLQKSFCWLGMLL